MLRQEWNKGDVIDGADMGRIAIEITCPEGSEEKKENNTVVLSTVTDLFRDEQFELIGTDRNRFFSNAVCGLALRSMTSYDVSRFQPKNDASFMLEIFAAAGVPNLRVHFSGNSSQSAHYLEYIASCGPSDPTSSDMFMRIGASFLERAFVPVPVDRHQVQEDIVQFLQQLGSPLYQPLQRLLAQNLHGVVSNKPPTP